jgi:hypothetical protein
VHILVDNFLTNEVIIHFNVLSTEHDKLELEAKASAPRLSHQRVGGA